MNFTDDGRTGLILEDIWGTPDGWKKKLAESEIQKHDDVTLRNLEMYFSLPELVLRAQYLLRQFV